MKIRQIFISYFALFAIIPVLIISFYGYTITESSIEKQTLQHLDSLASIEKNRLLSIEEIKKEQLDLLLSRTQLRIEVDNYINSNNIKTQNKINKILEDAKEPFSNIVSISVTDLSGTVIGSTDSQLLGSIIDEHTSLFTSDEKTIQFDVDENDVAIANMFGSLISDNIIIGILHVKYTPESFFPPDDYSGFGNSGESLIAMRTLDGDAKFIHNLRFEASNTDVISNNDLNIPITRALLKEEKLFSDLIDYRGQNVFAVTKYVEDLDLGVVVKIDKDEVLLPARNIQIGGMITVALLFLAIIISAIIISSKFSKPIEIIRSAAQDFAEGNLNKHIILRSNNEFNSLVASLNEMADSLSHKINIEEELFHTKSQMRMEKFSTIGKLSSRLAHDLRNPLAIIQISLENMKMLYDNDAPKIRQINKIERSIDRMTHQINNVLDFVRGKPLHISKEKLSDILRDSLDSINIPENVTVTSPTDDIELFCDKKQLSICLNNLIINGIQAVGGKGTIEINFEKNADSVVINIQDSGDGISPENIDKVFEPLFTTKQQGTGLGLASVKSIIELHGGKMSVSSSPTVFSITLPQNNPEL